MGSIQPKGNRFYIQVYWRSKTVKLYYDYEYFQPFYNRNRARQYLADAQRQIADGSFNPAHWKKDSPVLVSQKAKAWLDWKKAGKKCLQGYATAINKYIIPLIGNKDVRKLKAGELQDLYDLLLGRYTNEIAYKTMSTLRTMLRDLYRREEIFRVPPFPVMSRASGKKVVEYLSIDQQEILLKSISERHRPIFEFGMELGLRTQEVRAIQWDCIKDGRVIIKRAFTENELKGTKTGDERSLKLTGSGKRILESVRRNTSTTFLFVRGDGKPYTNKNINNIWHDAEIATGIKCKLQNAMRHSLACQLLDQGVPIETVKQILGHKNIRMTMRYTNRMITPSADAALENRRVVKIDKNRVALKTA